MTVSTTRTHHVNRVAAILLGAGAAPAMQSYLPPLVHDVCGRPLGAWVATTLHQVGVERQVVVLGKGAELVAASFGEQAATALGPLVCVEQSAPRGDADAVETALGAFPEDDFEESDVLVVSAASPLITAETLARLLDHHAQTDSVCTVLTHAAVTGGTSDVILRNRKGLVDKIVPAMAVDPANPDGVDLSEVSGGIWCFRRSLLAPALRRIQPTVHANRHGEGALLLTDIVEVLHQTGYMIETVPVAPEEALTVQDRQDMSRVIGVLRQRIIDRSMASGVTFLDPVSAHVDVDVNLGIDVVIDSSVVLRGSTTVGDGARIGPNTTLTSCAVGIGAEIIHSVGTAATVGANARIGPFSVLERNAEVATGSTVEPFTTVGGAS